MAASWLCAAFLALALAPGHAYGEPSRPSVSAELLQTTKAKQALIEEYSRAYSGNFLVHSIERLKPSQVSVTFSQEFPLDQDSRRFFVLGRSSVAIPYRMQPSTAPAARLLTHEFGAIVDLESDEFIPLVLSSAPMDLRLVAMRQNELPFIFVGNVCLDEYDCKWGKALIAFAPGPTGAPKESLKIQTYDWVEADGPSGSDNYVDRSSISWTDWEADGTRELVVNTDRQDLGSSPPMKALKSQQVYSLRGDTFVLVEESKNGQITLTREDAERLLAVQEASSETSANAGSQLVSFLGDRNATVAEAARMALWRRMYNGGKTAKLDSTTLSALVRQAGDRNSAGASQSVGLLYDKATSFRDPTLPQRDLDLLAKRLAESPPDITLINVLSFAGDSRAFEAGFSVLSHGLEKSDGCTADTALIGIGALLHQGTRPSTAELALLNRAAASGLDCGDASLKDGADALISTIPPKR